MFDLKENKKNILKSGISKDFKSRIQTVDQVRCKNYYNLIKAFESITGVPIVINTSLNLPGEVVVESLFDLYDLFETSKLEYIYLPEINKLIKKHN